MQFIVTEETMKRYDIFNNVLNKVGDVGTVWNFILCCHSIQLFAQLIFP